MLVQELIDKYQKQVDIIDINNRPLVTLFCESALSSIKHLELVHSNEESDATLIRSLLILNRGHANPIWLKEIIHEWKDCL